jgi:hypothetical protein
MGCEIENSGDIQSLDLIYQADNGGYSLEVLQQLSNDIVEATAWLRANIGDIDQDLIALRGGTPTITYDLDSEGNVLFDDSTNAQDVYTTLFGTDDSFLISGAIDIDYIKITSREDSSTSYAMYRYESPYVHKVFGNYFKDGIYNATRPDLSDDALVSLLVSTGTVGEDHIPYIDNLNLNGVKAYTGIIPVRYSGVLGLAKEEFIPVPDVLVNVITMISQNLLLFSSLSNKTFETNVAPRVIIGDKYVNTIQGFIYALARVKDTCDERISRFASNQGVGAYYEDIRSIFDIVGLDESFKSLRYGGSINDLRLLMRIPAAYESEKELKSYLEVKETQDAWNLKYPNEYIKESEVTDVHRDWYFSTIFVEEFVNAGNPSYTEDAIEVNPRNIFLWDTKFVIEALGRRIGGKAANYEDLYTINSWYDSAYELYEVINVVVPEYSATKGCKNVYEVCVSGSRDDTVGTTTCVPGGVDPTTDEELPEVCTTCTTHIRYRVYRVNYEWFKNAPPLYQAAIFMGGFELETEYDECPYDKVIAIVVAVIIAYYASPEAASAWWVWALYIVSTVISIGLAMGVWKGKQARDMAILGAILSLGSNIGSAATSAAKLSTNAIVAMVIQVANTALTYTTASESYAVAKELEELANEYGELKESAELYESNLKYCYGESFTAPIRAISEEDPYRSIKDIYSKFSIYETEGFRGNGFDRPLTYGWG